MVYDLLNFVICQIMLLIINILQGIHHFLKQTNK